ncbi:MAG: sugar phosphate isomerase/epimerase [Planctomycetes bacterium]|jgi:sugar phosphate isomerase/epimerase|nr:sugar phosphate isomerase/epimerase [Planctomycetota bacterium]
MHESTSNERTQRSRRRFLADIAQTAAVVGAPGLWATGGTSFAKDTSGEEFRFSVFSKCLQWLDYQGTAQIAAEAGYDGLDLTVRAGGHVLPERVEEDLPKAAETAAKAGLGIDMIVTDITDPRDAQTEKILKTARGLGVRYYRPGPYRYNNTDPIMAQLDEIKPRLRDLAAMNQQYGVAATYQNHAGAAYVGASLWDLHYLLRDLDPRWFGAQFDIRHTVVEGGLTWPVRLRLLAGWINTLAMKDFRWARQNNGWTTENCPLGEGMVDLAGFAGLLKRHRLARPTSLHFEYPLGGAEHGAREIKVERKVVLEALRSDLNRLRKILGLERA